MPDKLTEHTENITNILYFLLICVCLGGKKWTWPIMVLFSLSASMLRESLVSSVTVLSPSEMFFSKPTRPFLQRSQTTSVCCSSIKTGTTNVIAKKSYLFTFAVLFLSSDSLCFSFAVTVFD